MPEGIDLSFLEEAPITHRGLHDAAREVPENSLAAMAAAIARGFAIEIDLQAARDGTPMVFHDATLSRLTGEEGPLAVRDTSELARLKLLGTGETIPTLADALALVAGRVPLLIEVKSETRRPGAFEQSIAAAIATYRGPLAVMSFNPMAAGFFAEAAPGVPRGQVSCRYTDWEQTESAPLERILLQHLLVMQLSQPHFIAYSIKDAHRAAPQLARRSGLPLLVWTVRSPDEERQAATLADNIIFEGFEPARNGPHTE